MILGTRVISVLIGVTWWGTANVPQIFFYLRIVLGATELKR